MQLFLAARGVERRRKRARWCALRDLPVAHATEALRLSSRGSGHVARRHRWSHPAVGPRQLAPVTLPGVQRVARQGEPGTEAPPLRPRAGRTLRPVNIKNGRLICIILSWRVLFRLSPQQGKRPNGIREGVSSPVTRGYHRHDGSHGSVREPVPRTGMTNTDVRLGTPPGRPDQTRRAPQSVENLVGDRRRSRLRPDREVPTLPQPVTVR